MKILFVVAGVVILGAGYLIFNNNGADQAVSEVQNTQSAQEANMAEDSEMENTTAQLESGSASEPEMTDSGLMVDAETEIDTTLLPEAEPGEYIEYADGTLAYAETGDVVLFFHAPWCPSCRGLEDDINANLSAIPDGVSIQKVDYDSETELRKKYGIVRQHTLVQVDASGNKIKDFNGLNNTLEQVVAQIE